MCLTGIAVTVAATTAAPSVTVSAHVQRTSLDLLDSLPIAVVVQNATRTISTLRFRQPAEYAVEVAEGDTVLWSSLPPSPPPGVSYPVHQRQFGPGATTLAVFDWNEQARGGWSPLAGKYEIRVRLLSEESTTPVSVRVAFAPPLSPSSLANLKPDEAYTLAGTLSPSLDVLSDDRGSARLGRKILGAIPGTRLVVRGSAVTHPDGTRTFFWQRWAPYGAPVIAATLAPSASPR
jgi:hypothetical protein